MCTCRPNGNGSMTFKNVLSKAGSRLQGLRSTASSETLEYSDELERTKFYRSISGGKTKKKHKYKSSRESSSDIEEMIGSIINRTPLLYYKQGSSSLGARIAQSDYADPTTLFSESKRAELAASKQSLSENKDSEDKIIEENKSAEDTKKLEETRKAEEKREEELKKQRLDSENDSFYERSFETIENYIDVDVEDAFRDSAIFSDGEDNLTIRSSLIEFEEAINRMPIKAKVAPPVPAKLKLDSNSSRLESEVKPKPVVMQKPEHLKLKTKVLKNSDSGNVLKSPNQSELQKSSSVDKISAGNEETDDVSAGQSQAGWVRKMVGQLQSRVET